jgi:uncharacterized protein YeeX (DUF496 family)
MQKPNVQDIKFEDVPLQDLIDNMTEDQANEFVSEVSKIISNTNEIDDFIRRNPNIWNSYRDINKKVREVLDVDES